MKDNFIRQKFKKVFNIDSIITIFYMEFSKDFSYEGERHDFWEMVYVDKGEVICTADTKQFVLKGGELTFHKPNEFHNLSANKNVAPNVSIITFDCKSPAMNYFKGKIFKLSLTEKNTLSMLIEEGLSCYSMVDQKNPLLQQLIKLDSAPFGSSQMTKNLLECLLIGLSRHKDSLDKKERYNYMLDGATIPHDVKEIIDFLENNVYAKLSIDKIADLLGKSPSAIKKTFSSFKRNGIIDYFNRLKIKEAKRLIREKNYNFSQVSDMLGFDTPQYFSIVFKKYTKMSPKEYKNSILP
ncbi:MAG: helix-turn-helix domain-containing protein [Clostridia bacterium]|nr:helix-turn-helix domain-containing protein [Clostridia bacterium]